MIMAKLAPLQIVLTPGTLEILELLGRSLNRLADVLAPLVEAETNTQPKTPDVTPQEQPHDPQHCWNDGQPHLGPCSVASSAPYVREADPETVERMHVRAQTELTMNLRAQLADAVALAERRQEYIDNWIRTLNEEHDRLVKANQELVDVRAQLADAQAELIQLRHENNVLDNDDDRPAVDAADATWPPATAGATWLDADMFDDSGPVEAKIYEADEIDDGPAVDDCVKCEADDVDHYAHEWRDDGPTDRQSAVAGEDTAGETHNPQRQGEFTLSAQDLERDLFEATTKLSQVRRQRDAARRDVDRLLRTQERLELRLKSVMEQRDKLNEHARNLRTRLETEPEPFLQANAQLREENARLVADLEAARRLERQVADSRFAITRDLERVVEERDAMEAERDTARQQLDDARKERDKARALNTLLAEERNQLLGDRGIDPEGQP